MTLCVVDGCNREQVARDWCRKHYERWKRHGDPLVTLRPGGTCSLDGCDRQIQARRFCRNHYRRFMLYGDPLGGPGKGSKPKDPVARFWNKVDRRGPDDCWLWTGGVSNTYGHFWLDGRTVPAHRFAYEVQVGPIPKGLHIDHLCRVRTCVNARHLEPVTFAENNRRSESPSARNARKTHCPQGHPYNEHGVFYRDRRYCAICYPAPLEPAK